MNYLEIKALMDSTPSYNVIDPTSESDCPFKKSLKKTEEITDAYTTDEIAYMGMVIHSTRAGIRRAGAVREMRTLPFKKSTRPEVTFIPTDFLDKTIFETNAAEFKKLDSKETASQFTASTIKDPRLWSIHALSSEVNRFTLTKD